MDDITTGEKAKKCVLVVDTDAVDRFSTCMLLQRFGYYIFTASTPEEAVEFMSVSRPSAIVANAGKSVARLLSEINKDIRFAAIPVILLSKSDDEMENHRSKAGKIAAYLRKPIHVEEFYRVIQSVIENGSRRNIRISTHLAAVLEDEFSATEGIVSDLSEEGLFFKSFDPRPQNTHIPISVQIMERTILLKAVVLYCNAVEEGSFRKSGMGIKFEKISPVDRDLIKTFILDKVREGMSRQRYYNC